MANDKSSGQSGITITAENGETIVLTSTNTSIKFETFAENVRNKSKSVNATVTITGKIKDTDTSELKKVFNWNKRDKLKISFISGDEALDNIDIVSDDVTSDNN